MTTPGRLAVLAHFRWVGGHGDIWRVFADGDALRAVIGDLAAPWRNSGLTKVVAVESRAFLLGAATAVELGLGFVAIRKGGTGLLPGPKLTARAEADYRGLRHDLRMQDVLDERDRVLLVDDWAETGSQAGAAAGLVTRSGAAFVGASLVVDMLSEQTRAGLGRVTSLVTAIELGDPDGG